MPGSLHEYKAAKEKGHWHRRGAETHKHLQSWIDTGAKMGHVDWLKTNKSPHPLPKTCPYMWGGSILRPCSSWKGSADLSWGRWSNRKLMQHVIQLKILTKQSQLIIIRIIIIVILINIIIINKIQTSQFWSIQFQHGGGGWASVHLLYSEIEEDSETQIETENAHRSVTQQKGNEVAVVLLSDACIEKDAATSAW